MNDIIPNDIKNSQPNDIHACDSNEAVPQAIQTNEKQDTLLGMPHNSSSPTRTGKVKLAVLLWAIGVPIPIVLIVLLLRSCS